MAAVAFPSIRPSSRNYTPGRYPRVEFKSLNGATTTLQYGSRRFDAELSLEFENISDAQTVQILRNYELVGPSDDWVTFKTSSGSSGASAEMAAYFEETGGSGLRWRYADPPSVVSVFKGTNRVSCKFIAQLDGA